MQRIGLVLIAMCLAIVATLAQAHCSGGATGYAERRNPKWLRRHHRRQCQSGSGLVGMEWTCRALCAPECRASR